MSRRRNRRTGVVSELGVEKDTTEGVELEHVLELLRTSGLSIKNLDEPTKAKVRFVMRSLHHEKGLSLGDIAKLIGNKTSGYTSWLFKQLQIQPRPFEESRLKAIKEKRRKYERKPFDGTDEDRAYLLALRHGDLTAYKPWIGAVRVSTSTTHPAMADLFAKLFSPFGHVYQHPRYKKDTKSYEWNLQTILDDSFEFLLMAPKRCWDWVSGHEKTVIAYVAGMVDAEGSIGIYPNKNDTALTVNFYNTNVELLWFIHREVTKLGYSPLEPYLDKPKGFRSSGYHIEMKKDYWRVVLARFNESQSLIRRLPLRHSEKIAKQQLALTLSLGDHWINVRDSVQEIRNAIRVARDQFVQLAEDEYVRKHSNE